MLVHILQILAISNVFVDAGYMKASDISSYLEAGTWSANFFQYTSPENVTNVVAQQIGGNTQYVYGFMRTFGFCLTPPGFLYTIFNVTSGLFLVYLFIFADVWRVIFGTTITRNFPNDPNYKLMLIGSFLLVCMNAAILTWLGVTSGFGVLASSGDFFNCLFSSLTVFIILALDETVLPFVRFCVEEAGWMNREGVMLPERLNLLYHGSQYYKPGYGQHWKHVILNGPVGSKLVAILNIFVMLAIIVAPLGVSIHAAVVSFKAC